ncbi:MAG: thymidine kinase [Gammaproteobacteria bacterium]|jgi:thymidine kinase|nr:thymidine kinase [Gammaproteobacteria bacterium]
MAKLFFYYSAMNAGKSTTLLQSSYNYRERGMDTLLFAPSIDTRSTGKVWSRIGLEANAILYDDTLNFFDDVRDRLRQNPRIACVFIDEAQFLTKAHVSQLTDVPDKLHIPVLAYGLRTDFRGDPFEGSQYLFAWADEIHEIKTICHCGSKATMNVRIDKHNRQVKTGAQVEIGGNDRYVATCRKHFKEGNTTGREIEDNAKSPRREAATPFFKGGET